MREVAVFIAPCLYDSNKSFVSGLQKNEISVTRFDVYADKKEGNPYLDAVKKHNKIVAESPEGGFSQFNGCSNHDAIEDYNFLCIAIEDSRRGVTMAHNSGMCVIGIGSNEIELNRLMSQGAHAVAKSVSDVLHIFKIHNYYQVQYLPYAIYLRDIVNRKVGYPVSLLDTLRGRFMIVPPETDDDGIADIDQELDDLSISLDQSERKVELNNGANRIIPREVLGIEPGSLADVYINNVGWPQDKINNIHFNSRGLEMDCIRMFAKLYEISYDEMRGFLTSGGTEGNFCGLWWQRDYLKRKSGGHDPIILTSNLSHYSVSKACQQLCIEGRLISTLPEGSMNCEELERILISISDFEPERPILMQVNIGTTMTGAIGKLLKSCISICLFTKFPNVITSVDDLPTIHSLLLKHVSKRGGIFTVHMDAALTGAILPIIKPFGDNINYFRDFNVKTIAISGHKFFGSVCICGVLLACSDFLEECFNQQEVGVKYLTGLHDITPSGSRSGFNVLSFHNTLCGLYCHTDARRLKDIVAHCIRNTDYFVERMSELVGEEKMIHPLFSLQVCFPRPSEKMMQKYSLMPVTMPDRDDVAFAGVCILVNVDKTRINEFMVDYKKDKVAKTFLK